ncbi:MAG: hypothetical protein JWO02_1740 [Solirubrobacterales bacterium]|nr:hypothetical protein [Solirubrobacterales bacterium]
MTMISPTPTGLARTLGACLGVAGAALLLFTARPSANVPRLPATVRLAVASTGELEVTPTPLRRVLGSRSLVPGGRRTQARFTIRNQTGKTLVVGFRAPAASTPLDGLLRVRLSSAGASLANSTLQGLRRGSAATLRIASGTTRRLRVQAWIPRDISDGYEGQQATVLLTPTVKVGA